MEPAPRSISDTDHVRKAILLFISLYRSSYVERGHKVGIELVKDHDILEGFSVWLENPPKAQLINSSAMTPKGGEEVEQLLEWSPWKLYLVMVANVVLNIFIPPLWLLSVALLGYFWGRPGFRKVFWTYLAVLLISAVLFVVLGFSMMIPAHFQHGPVKWQR